MNDFTQQQQHHHHHAAARAPPARGPPPTAAALYPPSPSVKSFQGARGGAGFRFQPPHHEYHVGPYSYPSPSQQQHPQQHPQQQQHQFQGNKALLGRHGHNAAAAVSSSKFGGAYQLPGSNASATATNSSAHYSSASFAAAYGYSSYGAAAPQPGYASGYAAPTPPPPQQQQQQQQQHAQYASSGYNAPDGSALGVLVSSATTNAGAGADAERKFRYGVESDGSAAPYMTAQFAERQVGIMQMKMSALGTGGDGLGGVNGAVSTPQPIPLHNRAPVHQHQQQQQQQQQIFAPPYYPSTSQPVARGGHHALEPQPYVTPAAAGASLMAGYSNAPAAGASSIHTSNDSASSGGYMAGPARLPPYGASTAMAEHSAGGDHNSAHSQEQQVCALCFGAGWDKVATCGHRFHAACIQQWGGRSGGCLVCAQNMQALAGTDSGQQSSMAYNITSQQQQSAAASASASTPTGMGMNMGLNMGMGMSNGFNLTGFGNNNAASAMAPSNSATTPTTMGGRNGTTVAAMNRPPPIDTGAPSTTDAPMSTSTVSTIGSKRGSTLTPTPSSSNASTSSSSGSLVASTAAMTTTTIKSASGGKRKTKKLKECSVPGCDRTVRSRGLCKGHGGGRRCGFSGCGLSDQGGGFCISHGGGKRCQRDGCDNSAQSRGLCKLHGGGSRCTVPNCTKSSQGRGLCRAHGGGRRCMVEGCNKTDRRAGYCVTHGADRKCIVQDCSKTGRMDGLCTKHYFERHPPGTAMPIVALATMANPSGVIMSKRKPPVGGDANNQHGMHGHEMVASMAMHEL